tara:strand:+ start:920 stop:1150 length:231 start_codon:yes stop_codon:yes gene_type:complete
MGNQKVRVGCNTFAGVIKLVVKTTLMEKLDGVNKDYGVLYFDRHDIQNLIFELECAERELATHEATRIKREEKECF